MGWRRKVKGMGAGRLFYKYFVSFLVVALVPMGILVASFYGYNVKSLWKQTEVINLQKLGQASGLVDEVVLSHLRMAAAVGVDSMLRPGLLSGSVYEQYQCLYAMKPYLNKFPGLEKAYFVLLGKDCVYSSSGIMNYETFVQYEFDVLDRVKGMGEVGSFFRIFSVGDVGGDVACKGRIAFVYPVPTYSPYGVLVFLMDQDAAAELVGSVFKDGDARTAILSQEWEVLASSGLSDGELELLTGELLSGRKAGGITFDRGRDGKFSLLYCVSEETGLIYTAVLPKSVAADGDGRVQRNLLIFSCFLILILCLLLSVAVSFFNYRPIRELMRLMDKNGGKKDELQALHQYIEEQEKIKDASQWQEPYLQQRIMELFLDGMIDESELERAFQPFRYPGDGSCYTAVVISLFRERGNIQSLYRQEILNFSLEMEIRNGIHICCIEKLRDSSIIWVINAQNSTDFTELTLQIVNGIAPILKDTPDIRFVLGIGGAVHKLPLVKDSFYEALASAEYLRQNRIGRVLFYQNLAENLKQSKAPDMESLLKLFQALRHGDSALSLRIFTQYFDNLTVQYRSVLLFQYFAFDMLKSLKDALEDCVPEELQNEIVSLIQVDQPDSLRKRMETLIGNICVFTAQSQKSHQKKLTGEVLAFVRENAFNPELSLERLGDEFSLSPYYISRFITEQTGDNLKNYIARLRMEEAKHLLKDTELPLYEIVTRIGYLDVSSFIRKFKKEAGCTPGEFRDGKGTV